MKATCNCGTCGKCSRRAAYRASKPPAVCRCGSRGGCDCARWEQIFRDKFEDPTYYQPEAYIRSAGSSLAGVVGLDIFGTNIPAGVANGPEWEQWRALTRGEAAEGIARREKATAA